MRKIFKIQAGGYYLIESKATARNCYFENEEEIEVFRKLFKRYLGGYIEIHKMYFSSEGYQILRRVRGKGVLRKKYIKKCEKKGRVARNDYWEEPWRIVSEQIRIFHSVYAKWVNGERERCGGLVQERYGRYYFESREEFGQYIESMERGSEIKGQRNKKYEVEESWKKGVRWGFLRGLEWVGSAVGAGFQNYVVYELIKNTLTSHSSKKKPISHLNYT